MKNAVYDGDYISFYMAAPISVWVQTELRMPSKLGNMYSTSAYALLFVNTNTNS